MIVELVDSGRFDRMRKNIKSFRRDSKRALNRAEQTATRASRQVFRSRLSGRPHAPNREGRPSTGGNFARIIRWEQQKRGDEDFVAFQLRELEGRAPYWLIQEIGTGESATIIDQGRGVSVQSQVGRLISPSLVWSDTQRNFDVPRGKKDEEGNTLADRIGGGDGQLMRLRDVKNAPIRADLDPMFIGTEIEGKHYIKEGGEYANQQYRQTLLELAKRTFR